MDMYQKREMRKNKKMNENTKSLPSTSINWFPGHMTKTRREMEEDIKLVDIVYELTDARIPQSGRNPEIDKIVKDKPRLLLLNKCDMADKDMNNRWISYYKERGENAYLISAGTGIGVGRLNEISKNILKDKIAMRQNKGLAGDTVKAMIVGIPNVGKSTLINKLSGKSGAKTGDRPGVTRGRQWITARDKTVFLDTPGILWPKFDDENTGLKLAYTGAVKDEILDIEELALHFIGFMKRKYPQNLIDRYKLTNLDGEDADILFDIGKKRGCVISGGDIDYQRAANLIFDDFRGVKLGNLTLESPEDF